MFYFCFRELVLPPGPMCHKIAHIICEGIVQNEKIDVSLDTMICAYQINDRDNKYLNAGARLCQGRSLFITKVIQVQEH